jgi:hypothetical protein
VRSAKEKSRNVVHPAGSTPAVAVVHRITKDLLIRAEHSKKERKSNLRYLSSNKSRQLASHTPKYTRAAHPRQAKHIPCTLKIV